MEFIEKETYTATINVGAKCSKAPVGLAPVAERLLGSE